MATVLVKNLPGVSTFTDTDLLIINDGSGDTYTTSQISISNFTKALNDRGQEFGSDVTIKGNLTVEGTATFDLTGQAETVSTLSNFTTADLAEDTRPVVGNYYFTLDRFNNAFEATPLGRLNDVILTGGNDSDKARDGDFLIYNGVSYRFENVASATYDQRTEVADLGSQFNTLNTTVSALGVEQTAQGGRLDALETDVATNTTNIGLTEGGAPLQTQINDLGAVVGNPTDATTAATVYGNINKTGAAFNAIRAEAIAASDAFASASTDQEKLNACQTFFDNVRAIAVV